MHSLKLYWLSREFRQQLTNSRPRLFRVAYSWCHQPDLADDLVQETMAKAIKYAKQLRDKNALQSWLFGIMANCWHDYLRKLKHMDDIDDLDDALLSHNDTPEQYHVRQDIVDLIQNTMAELPIGQRQVLGLVELEGFSYAEVANILDIPVGTVMSRLSRARAQMAERLLVMPQAQEHIKTLRRVI